MIKLNYISVELSEKLGKYLDKIGIPSENRFLVISPKDECTTTGGIIVPGVAKDTIPRKGVIIQKGVLTEVPPEIAENLKTGRIITYGLYAGKEIEPDYEGLTLSEKEKNTLANSVFTVLSYSEIIYIEVNK